MVVMVVMGQSSEDICGLDNYLDHIKEIVQI